VHPTHTAPKTWNHTQAQVVPDGAKFSLASFHLHSVLGRGNFGKVFLAEGKKDKRLYAIKCIKKHYTIAQEEVERYADTVLHYQPSGCSLAVMGIFV
jgi:serine/threonine protein kinase